MIRSISGERMTGKDVQWQSILGIDDKGLWEHDRRVNIGLVHKVLNAFISS